MRGSEPAPLPVPITDEQKREAQRQWAREFPHVKALEKANYDLEGKLTDAYRENVSLRGSLTTLRFLLPTAIGVSLIVGLLIGRFA